MLCVATIAVPCLLFEACDTLIADRMVIGTPADAPQLSPNTPEVMRIAHDALLSCGVCEADLESDRGNWLWKAPPGSPGLHVMVRPAVSGVRVTLAQNLYGPVGPTETYRCVRQALRGRLEARYGKAVFDHD